jgi:2Fe-2S ferredoxin
MPKITFLPHEKLCPRGATLEVPSGESILMAALNEGVNIEHACEMACACTTCHVIVRKGYNSMTPPDELEDDLLDKAWGLTATSRLGCQAIVGDEDLEVEIPKYTINQVSEGN